MTREQMDKRLLELARRYVETHDPKVMKEIYELADELQRMEKKIEG
jgi:hypothetical protein